MEYGTKIYLSYSNNKCYTSCMLVLIITVLKFYCLSLFQMERLVQTIDLGSYQNDRVKREINKTEFAR